MRVSSVKIALQSTDMIPVHNAGIMPISSVLDTTQEMFSDVIDTNVKGPFFLTQAVLPYIPSGGRIILISSTSARISSIGAPMSMYSASKAALESFARTWAYEVSRSAVASMCLLDLFY